MAELSIPDNTLIRIALATLGRKGGKSRSKLKLEAARKNVLKAQAARRKKKKAA
jgi:hypothetical protein